jgi:hypothetical protein
VLGWWVINNVLCEWIDSLDVSATLGASPQSTSILLGLLPASDGFGLWFMTALSLFLSFAQMANVRRPCAWHEDPMGFPNSALAPRGVQVIGEFNVNWPDFASNIIFRTASILDFDVVSCPALPTQRRHPLLHSICDPLWPLHVAYELRATAMVRWCRRVTCV